LQHSLEISWFVELEIITAILTLYEGEAMAATVAGQGSTMKAVVRTRYGSPDVLELREIDKASSHG
jgi:hypothetical protein